MSSSARPAVPAMPMTDLASALHSAGVEIVSDEAPLATPTVTETV